MALTYSSGTVVFGEGGTYTKYGTTRPWQEQWYLATVHFRALNAVYQPGGRRGADAAKAAAEDFFEHCLRVKDWVKGDTAQTRSEKRKLENLLEKNASLSLGRDIANTTKHRGRNKESDRNAVIRRVHHRDDESESVDIEWWMQNQENDRNTEDALKVAEGCMAAWRQYFKGRELRLWEVRTRKNDL